MVAIDNLDLEIEPGEFLVLLGPSGCGKTTTLRCIAGLETGEEGSIEIGDGAVFDASRGINVPPNKRNLGMVFQSYALWPHMTVRKNIGYPLRTRGIKGDKANQWIEEVAALVDTSALLDRYPAQLSGGQQQRVALSRGLVARPEIVLFDEPLSNLDARLRDLVRTEIHELHARLGFTAVYVTHDQVEALALGDRLAIMRAGRARAARDAGAGIRGAGHRLRRRVHRDGEPARARTPRRTLDARRRAGRRAGDRHGGQTIVIRTRSEDVDLAPPSDAPPHDSSTFQGDDRRLRVRRSAHRRRAHDRRDTSPESDSGGRAGELGAHARAWPTSPRVDQATRDQDRSTTPGSSCRRALGRSRSEAEMSTGAVRHTRAGGVNAKRLATRLGILAFVLALAYLSVLPLVRLQINAFDDNGQAYRDAWTRDRGGDDRPLHDRARARIAGHRTRGRHVPRLGCERPAAKTPLPEDPPDLPDHPARRVGDRRLGVPALARSRLRERSFCVTCRGGATGSTGRSTSTRSP